MKKQTLFSPKPLIGLMSGLVLLIANLSPLAAQAAGASISLSVNSSHVSPGSSFIVAVYMNGGGKPINAVEADLSFSASKLQYVGVNYNGSAFEITAPSGGSGGAVSIARGTTGAVSGSGLVATVTFKALGSSGSTAISLGGNSALSNDGNSVPFLAVGTSVTFSAGSAAPTSSSSTHTSSSSTTATSPATPATPAPPKDTTPPVISGIKLTNVTPFSATVTWATSEASNSAVDYGLDTSYGLSASSAGKAVTHSVALSSSFLTPLATLHYHVKSADAAGNMATSPDQTLQLPGVPVTVTVYGSNGKPQAGASVSLDSQSATTNAQGTATLQSGLGNKQLITSYDGMTIKKSITVAKSSHELTNYQLDLNRQPLNRWMLTTFSLLVLLFVLVGFDAYMFRSRIFGAILLRLHYWHQTRPTPAFAGVKTEGAAPAPKAPVVNMQPTSAEEDVVPLVDVADGVPSAHQAITQAPVSEAAPLPTPTPTLDTPSEPNQPVVAPLETTPLAPAKPAPKHRVTHHKKRNIPIV